MKKCSICKKNMAVAFISKLENGKPKMEGICIECAKKMGFPIMNQLMEQTGMSSEEVENLTEQMNAMYENGEMDDMEIDEENAFKDIFRGALPFMKGSKDLESDDLESDELESNKLESKEEKTQKSDNIKQTKEKDKKDTKGKKSKKKKKKYLDTYGTNLTDKAKNNQVDKIVGRHREIDRVIQILNRRQKNNPILIGEPGVGKTAIAEGLAVRIVEQQVPIKLFDTEVYLLDLTAVVAGTQFRGQFEGRMKSIIKEASECGNVILVIDEVHNIMGAGEVHGGVMNAANILKPALARGEIQIIGATTIDEYRKHIEKDTALERRFQPVLVEEPSIDESIEILQGIKDYYEDYHQVKISNDVIEVAVKLSQRYINDRYLPDKAIDVIDEAGSRANLKNKGLVELAALEEELDDIEVEKEIAAENSDYEKAADLKMNEIKIQEKIEKIKEECTEVEITVEDIAYVIEAWTKIPVQKITEEEAAKLLKLEDRLHNRVIGQNEAIESISKAIRRNRSGFKKRKKPSSFIFVGPTGVGKTELVRALAHEIFGSEEAMIRIDMSEYMEKHTVSKLIGAPPGYVGYDQGGQLTEKVRRKPYSVILLDEIEKAHYDVFNMLLQILEDGRLTDSQGRTVYFDNAIIVMTSNAGTNLKSSGIGFGKQGYDALENKVKEALKDIFRPEFLNRVDDTIVFTKLTREELRKIIDLMLKEIIIEAKEKNITIDVDDKVKEFILEKGYDEKYGARPLRRTIQKYIEDEIAEQYIQNKVVDGAYVKVVMKDDKVTLEVA
ncbi:ATP-dependent Clp protease ATP-binding subunit [Sporosalibacterium faouarense]|uniref:ATP-dependent Clp protease ATP-binding subunit n=1 Tax=Sporosalibacterium faouarense TaxID=516123 RepID=UPI00141CD230|nr:ATP-dependent Clp protease ATP-binding subunit [Sporosalibacterium faouarense]MTI47437.1 ATP-dependent Clp protease ATP-binding subunit [Bacillota bacterium]